MAPTLMLLTGDVNLMNVTDPTLPFAQIGGVLNEADVLFGNLECCFYQPGDAAAVTDEGFFASPAAGRALQIAGYDAIGNANNVNYGAAAIRSSLAELGKLGVPSTGAGLNRAQARAPVIIERNGLRYGFLQRTSVYWPNNHEAGKHTPGIAALRGHTAYHVPWQRLRPDLPPANRPGVPPLIVTWADAKSLAEYVDELKALRPQVDVLVASHHWGYQEEVLEYMAEIAHAAIDAGADVVVGHGPHYALPVEFYKDKPVFYGLGSFSFHSGHRGQHGDWLGLLARITLDGKRIGSCALQLVRHNDRNETVLCNPAAERAELDALNARCATYGTRLRPDGMLLAIERQP